jgi:hypothetical protein
MSGNWIVPSADPSSNASITITGTLPIVVTQPNPGEYDISYDAPTALYTWPEITVPDATVVNGGGIAVNYGNITIPAFIHPVLNPTLTLTVVMSGIGTKINQLGTNNLSVGLFDDTNNNLALGYFFSGQPLPNLNWGTTIGDPLNVEFTGTFPIEDMIAIPFFCSFFVSFPVGTPAYAFSSLKFSVSTVYVI